MDAITAKDAEDKWEIKPFSFERINFKSAEWQDIKAY